MSIAETGIRMYLAVDTVKNHRQRVLRKWGVVNITQAVALAVGASVITPRGQRG